MKGMRLRLTYNERIYLLRLIGEDTKLQQALVSKSILNLISKLTEDNKS
jgi:hypothetical protein